MFTIKAAHTAAACRFLWLMTLVVVSHGFVPPSSSSFRSHWRHTSTNMARRIPSSGINHSSNVNEGTLLLNQHQSMILQASSSSSLSETTTYPRWKFWKRLGRHSSSSNNDNKRRMRNHSSSRRQTATTLSFRKKMRWVPVMASFLAALFIPRLPAVAGGAMGGGIKAPVAPMERNQLISLSALWFAMFVGLALLHACEIAITTLYPWKVREIAEEEEKQGKSHSVFKTLNEDITRVLTTILVASTACSIFATTIFTHLVASVFGTTGERWGAIALTALTLFFVELLPKSLGVTNAEVVARLMVPPVNIVSTIVSPLGISLSWLAKRTLLLLGVRDKKDGGVSDSQLRLIVTGARDSGTIDHGEQEMIQGVLNLQDQRVKELMKPRVEMIAVPVDMSVVNVLGVVRESGYSRIPVYDGEIDNIVGIVLAKDVLDFFVHGVLVDDESWTKKGSRNVEEVKVVDVGGDSEKEEVTSPESISQVTQRIKIRNKGEDEESYVRTLTAAELASRMEMTIKEANLVESCYFVPDTANGWSVLQEMRRRRVHMAIVVDEYGGTEGLVSLEDIVEQVVGEIYDEDDAEDFQFSEESITLQEDGSFLIRGDADLEDVDTILGLQLSDEVALKEFATLSGFLCMCAGEIPTIGDFIMSRGWSFDILNADEKKILLVKVERLIGSFDEEEDELVNDNPLKNLLKLKINKEGVSGGETGTDDQVDIDEAAEVELQGIIAANAADAKEIERMVDASERKIELLAKAKEEEYTSEGNGNRDSSS